MTAPLEITFPMRSDNLTLTRKNCVAQVTAVIRIRLPVTVNTCFPAYLCNVWTGNVLPLNEQLANYPISDNISIVPASPFGPLRTYFRPVHQKLFAYSIELVRSVVTRSVYERCTFISDVEELFHTIQYYEVLCYRLGPFRASRYTCMSGVHKLSHLLQILL